jgi:hypothetical protein
VPISIRFNLRKEAALLLGGEKALFLMKGTFEDDKN